jgi:hypothetical protein
MKWILPTAVAVVAVFGAVASASKAEQALMSFPHLMVQQASSATYDGKTLTLRGVATIVWFSNRPERLAGHMGTEAYLAGWQPGGSFAGDPPNAALAIPKSGDATDETVIVTLNTAKVVGDGVYAYDVTVVSGNLPKEVENAVLFVDPSGSGDPGNGAHQ